MKLRLSVSLALLLGLCALAAAQNTPASDSSSLAASLTGKYRSLFGKEWSKKFVEAWNSNGDTARALGGLGKVYFVSVDEETTTVLMEFDSAGRAAYRSSIAPASNDTMPRFTARLIRWAEFMEGKFGAIAGVLTKKIDYAGPYRIAFKYGFAFGKVAPVGRRVSEHLNHRGKNR